MLSPNFSLEQLSFDPLALFRSIDNTPTGEQLNNLRIVANDFLEPLRSRVGSQINIVAGYRCPELCDLYGDNLHSTGRCVDFRVDGWNGWTLINLIKAELNFTLLIPEFMAIDKPDGWIHVAFDHKHLDKSYIWTMVAPIGGMI